jgi:hypothetical protein
MNAALIGKYSASGLMPGTFVGHWIESPGESALASVIVPTYNRGRVLLNALHSVLQQSYRPIELIVVDDGSSDDTEAVLKDWRAQQEFDAQFSFTYLKQANAGAQVARNWGALASRGQYIQFLDSDDLLLPTKIESGVRILEQDTQADYVYARAQFKDTSGKLLSGYFGRPASGTDRDVTQFLWQTMCPLFRRETLAALGPWREELVYEAHDWELGARADLLGFSKAYDPSTQCHFSVGGTDTFGAEGASPRQLESLRLAYFRIAELAIGLERFSPEIRTPLLKRLGLTCLQFAGRGDWPGCQRTIQSMAEVDCLPLPLQCLLRSICFLRLGGLCRFLEKRLVKV